MSNEEQKVTYLFEATIPGVRANYLERKTFYFKEGMDEKEKKEKIQEAYNQWVLQINSGNFTPVLP